MFRNKEVPFFFGKPFLKGSYHELDVEQLNPDHPELFYSHPNGEISVGDSIAWLSFMKSESIDLIFADPPYNIKRQNGTHLNPSRSMLTGLLNGLNRQQGF